MNQAPFVETVGMMDKAYFASKTELITWLQNDFAIFITEIEQCGTGAVYVQIMDRMFPGSVAMSKVRWTTKQSHEAIHNYKLLQSAFDKCNIKRNIEVEKLVKCKCQDNLEFLQWIKGVYDRVQQRPDSPAKAPGFSYDPYRRREMGMGPYPDWAPVHPPLTTEGSVSSSSSNTSYVRSNSIVAGNNNITSIKKNLLIRPASQQSGSRSNFSTGADTFGGQKCHTRTETPLTRPRPSSQRQPSEQHQQQDKQAQGLSQIGNRSVKRNNFEGGRDSEIRNDDLTAEIRCLKLKNEQLNEALEFATINKEFFYNKLVILERLCLESAGDKLSIPLVKSVIFSATDVPASVIDFSKSDFDIMNMFDEWDQGGLDNSSQSCGGDQVCTTTTGGDVMESDNMIDDLKRKKEVEMFSRESSRVMQHYDYPN